MGTGAGRGVRARALRHARDRRPLRRARHHAAGLVGLAVRLRWWCWSRRPWRSCRWWIRTQDGRNAYQLIADKRSDGCDARPRDRRPTSRGRSRGATPGGSSRPDFSAGCRMAEGRDAYDRDFGVLFHRTRNFYSIVLGCEPDGGSLVDPDQVDTWVAAWGGWLARLSHEPQLRGASVIVETAPDSGTRLANEVLPRLDPNAPPAARAVMEEVVQNYPAGVLRDAHLHHAHLRPPGGQQAQGRRADHRTRHPYPGPPLGARRGGRRCRLPAVGRAHLRGRAGGLRPRRRR